MAKAAGEAISERRIIRLILGRFGAMKARSAPMETSA
jgi:hypothetical protein